MFQVVRKKTARGVRMKAQSATSSLIMGILLFFGFAVLGHFINTSVVKFKDYERSVTVKGLSEKEYPADIVLWPIQFSVSDNELTPLYEAIERDAGIIKEFLESNGIEAAEINASVPSIIDKLAVGYEKSKIEYRYSANQTITVYSAKIETVKSTMNKLGSLVREGFC